MNINSNHTTSLNFKGISPDVMKNFGKFRLNDRCALAEHYNRLEQSPFVDLIMRKDKLALKIKKDIYAGASRQIAIKKDTIITSTPLEYTKETCSFSIKDLKIIENKRNKTKDLDLFFSDASTTDVFAHTIKSLSIPSLGGLIDLAQQIRPYYDNIDRIVSCFLTDKL